MDMSRAADATDAPETPLALGRLLPVAVGWRFRRLVRMVGDLFASTGCCQPGCSFANHAGGSFWVPVFRQAGRRPRR